MLWDLVWGRSEPTLPKRSKEKMDMDLGFNPEVDGDLCEGCEQHQFTSVLIRIFLQIVLIFCEPSNICLCRFYINQYHSKCTYRTEAVFETKQTSTRIYLPTVHRHNVLSAPIKRECFNAHTHITFTCIQHIRVNAKNALKGGWSHQSLYFRPIIYPYGQLNKDKRINIET